MANSFFQFKQFTIHQDACAMKVCTDACLFGAWCAAGLKGNAAQTLLDVGTGTGLLSLMVRQKSAVQINAVEIEAAAASQARQNVLASPWPDTIPVVACDVLNLGVLKKYDYIISNPPFYEADLKSPDSRRATAHHSRQLTLQALLSVIATRLHEDGCFFLLLPYKRHQESRALVQQNGLFLHKEVLVRQTKNQGPFRIMLQGGFVQKEVETTSLAIAGNDQNYTPEFTALLKDYYLYL